MDKTHTHVCTHTYLSVCMIGIHCCACDSHISTYSLLCNGIIHSLDDEISTDDESVLDESSDEVEIENEV